MKRVYLTTLVTAALVVLCFAVGYSLQEHRAASGIIKVGFIYDSDESTPYTYNFTLAQNALERELQGRVKVYSRSNVPEDETLEPIQELARAGCEIIFTNNYSSQVVEAAREYPQIQFCQTSFNSADHDDYPANYHTFNGRIYQARYVSGVAAGLKLRDMIDRNSLKPEEALVGYIGAFPSVEVVSGYTAFLLGVRSVAPEAVMRVRYTGTWSSYSKEKASVRALIDEGCVVICQHTDTIGPAMACEEARVGRQIIHVGYNQSMTDIAPGTSLISVRVNWTPYVIGAVEAVLDHEPIEKRVGGSVHGNDASGGFEDNWIQVLELNRQIAAYGTQEKLDKVIEGLKRGTIDVFKGDYTAADIHDPTQTIDLKQGYKENDGTSWPTFHYLLQDVITVEENNTANRGHGG